MKNEYTTLILIVIVSIVSSKLTLRQAVELDVHILKCLDLDDINVYIQDITQWKEAIEFNNQLNDDLNGLLELERIIKNTKLSLKHQQSFTQIELKRDVQASFEIDLAKIMDLIQQMNKKQSKKDKLDLLTEIDICIQATKQKLQSTLSQTQHVSQDELNQLTTNLKQLLYIKQQCQKQQTTNHQKIGRNNKHYKPFSYDEYDDEFQQVFDDYSYDDDYDYDYDYDYNYDYDYDDYEELPNKQKRKQTKQQSKQSKQSKQAQQPKIEQPIKLKQEEYPEEQYIQQQQQEFEEQQYQDEQEQYNQQNINSGADYYVEQPKAYDALDPQNQYNVIQNDHIIEQQNYQDNDQNQQENYDDDQQQQEFIDQQEFQDEEQQQQQYVNQEYEEQQQFYEDEQIQPIDDQGQRFINLQNDDYDYQQDVDYQLEQENRSKNQNLQQIDDPALLDDSLEDYQKVDVITDDIKLDDDNKLNDNDELYQKVDEPITDVKKDQQPEEFKLTEQPKQVEQQSNQQKPNQAEQIGQQQQPAQQQQQQQPAQQQQPVQQQQPIQQQQQPAQQQQQPTQLQQPVQQQQQTQQQQQPIAQQQQTQQPQEQKPQETTQQQQTQQPTFKDLPVRATDEISEQQKQQQQPNQQQQQQVTQQQQQQSTQQQQTQQQATQQQPIQQQPTQQQPTQQQATQQQPTQQQPTQQQPIQQQPIQQQPIQQQPTQQAPVPLPIQDNTQPQVSQQESNDPTKQPEQKPLVDATQQPVTTSDQQQQPTGNPQNIVDPTQKPVDPTQQPVDPAKQPTDPTQQPIDSLKQPTDQTQQPTDPTQQTIDPTQKPVDPTQKPVDPTQQPIDPTKQSTDPLQQPTDPNQKPVDQTQQPVDPTQLPIDPTQQPTDPTQPTTDPTQQQPTDPTQQPTDQTQQPTEQKPSLPTDLKVDDGAQAPTVPPIASKAEDNPDQLIDPVKFVPFKHKPLQSTANVLVRQSKFYDSTVDGQAAYEIQFSNKELQDSEEYGYGYWMRTLDDLQPNEYHFLSRLTSIKEYLDYQNYGDRTLTNFVVGTSFVFATYDYVGREKNKFTQITLTQSITQRWYFVSFSYSSRKQKAVGFVLQYGKGREFQRIEIPCTHAPPFYMYMVVGGKHQHYKGLNGQFANIFYDVEAPALIDNEQELFQLVETMSYMPQGLKTYHEEMIAGPPVDLDGNTNCNFEKGFKDAFIYEQYAMSGWFRWVDNLEVKELNSFQIMNLRSNKVRVKENKQLGDRTLEIHFIRGLQNIGINFQTYSVTGNEGKGTEMIIKQVPYNVNLWTFVYFGFNQEEKKAYGVMIRSGSNEEVTIEGLEHRNCNSLYFTLGGDQTVASFNGRLSQVGVYLGPEAFVKSRKMDYNFGYGEGAVRLFQLVKPLILRGQQDVYEISYDQQESLINQILIQDDNNIKINGLSEYGIGLWTCWLSSIPKYLNNRSEFHQIIRMGTQAKLLELKDNKLIQSSIIQDIKDTTLQMRVGKKEYEFSTYNLLTNDIKKVGIQLDSQLEGQWNYLYYSYKRMNNNMGLSKGYVQYGINGQIKECQLEILHDYLIEYVELNVGKSNIPQFNGKLANIQMRIGNGGFIIDINQFEQFIKQEKPLIGINQNIRKSIQLIGQEIDMIQIKEEQNIFEQQQNTNEYSLSGWIKWNGQQQQGGLYNILMLIQKRLQDIKPGQTDQQLYIQRTDKNIIFGTYNCNGEDCTQNQEKNIEFGEYYNQWIFIYVGYSQKNKKLFTLCKFTFNQQQQIFQDINRILLSTFTIFLGKHYQLANQWIGNMKQWVLNVGEGSYIEGGFEQNETVELFYGYNSGLDHIKFQQANQEIDHSDKIIDSQADKQNIPWMIELNEQSNIKIDGVTQYGYGLWTRFRYYGQSILYTQPKWMGISRLTINKEYRDTDNIGDRVLMILFGKNEQDDKQIFQFSTYTIGQPNIFQIQQYNIENESEWIYIYYSYKRISQTQGMAIGYIGNLQIIDEIKIEALHNPINNYILLTIGHCGKYYPNFNGQITGIKFRLGNGSFIENKNDITQRIQNTDRIPQLPYDIQHKYTIMDGKIDNYKIIPNNPQMIDFPANEYSIALWYKYQTKINDNKETVFRVTQNPIDKVSDQSWIGDRTLSLFKINKDNMQFSTYTLLKNMNFGIPYNCQIPELSQHNWSFIYMGYKKQEKKLYYQLMVDEYICKSEEIILHAISDRMWIYIGSDNIQQRFEGSLAQIALTIGPGSYTNSKITFLPEYLVADKLFPKQKKISWEKNEPLYLQSDGDDIISSLKVELFNGFQYPFDQMQEYSYGLWTRYLTTIPERQYIKPALMQLTRLSINKQYTQNVIKTGDRVLAIHLVFNYYQISTYDLNTDTGIQQKFMKYNQLEGIWRYIYIGYNKDIETVSCYTYDTQINEIKIDKILHKPLSDYLLFQIGKEDTIPGFQGILTKIMLQIGPGSYIKQQDLFKSQIDTTFSLPFQLTQEYIDKEKHGKFEIIEDINQIDITNGLQFEGNRWSGISEYSFSGWIKQTGTLSTECQLLLRLTNNKLDQLNDRKSQGDRTLHMIICNTQLIKFSTYTLIDLKDANEPKFIDGQLELNDYNYAWNYVYMAYNQRTNEVHSLLHTLIEDKPLIWQQILHYVPNYLGLYIGQDKFTNKFIGQMNKWTAAYGLGAFISLQKNGYQQTLPYYSMIQPNKQFQWNSNKDTVYQTPEFIIQEFTNEIDSITEYAFGIWTRWLTDFPDHLNERKESHSIFRLTAKKEHQDKSQFLDRVLSTFLIKGSYDFSSYDMATNNFAANSLAAYDQIEGQWNFVYMSYKEGQVVGIVIVRDSAKALKVEFKAKHIPLVGYAKLLIGVPEFGHGQFHGWLFDPRLYLGQGSFLSESQKVVDLLQKIHRKLPLPVVDLADFKWAIPQMDTTEQIKTGFIDYKFLDKQESVEYSYGMWIQQSTLLPGMPIVPRLIARLTTNHPQFQKDSQLGDRTLLVSILNEKITYNTYLLQDPPQFEPKSEEIIIETLQWTYVFFQYKKGTALSYALQVKQPQFKQINALHIIPNVFYFYLIKDQNFAEFYGKMTDVKLYFGSSSYFDDPQVTIEKWPFDKKYLQPVNEPPINNQQITSAKITRNMDIQNEKYTGDY